ncbi:DUF2249 domain-containing protein [Microbacterium sp.]|uniref:DUF2249 domain-containing protein n=1 Tax=Microbacterium sp. TaxID=51671 RepID=UPI003A8639E4
MSENSPPPAGDPDGIREVDVRTVPRERRHRLILDAYHQLAVGQSLLLINDHEPRHLRDEFDRDLGGSFAWDAESARPGADAVQVRITKRARTALPRVVADTAALAALADAAGSIWQLDPAHRDLDSNVIALPPGGEIRRHDGPDLDVLILILAGDGVLETEREPIVLTPGELIWLPRTATRRFRAGADGIRYLTVHQRKPTLNISAPPRSPG